jgi:DNA-binding XRE family transcriptional regulator
MVRTHWIEGHTLWVKCYSLIKVVRSILPLRLVSTVPYEVAQASRKLGERVRLARIRRRMTQEELAAACGITRKTLYAIEKGSSATTVGTLFSVLWKLGLLESAAELADPDHDEHGKVLESARQPKRVRQSTKIDNDF